MVPSEVFGCDIDGCRIGIRAEICSTRIDSNAISDASLYGIRVGKNSGCEVRDNVVSVEGTQMEPSRGIYVDAPDVQSAVVGNLVTVGDMGGSGITVYQASLEPVRIDTNEVQGASTGVGDGKGIRFFQSKGSAEWNIVEGFTYCYRVNAYGDCTPELGRADGTWGNNSTDGESAYNVYAMGSGGADTLYAQKNWWGTASPSGRQFYGAGIEVLWQPYLASDPNERGPEGEWEAGKPRYYLAQNHPNPFNPVTTVGFGLPEEQHVAIRIFDVSGRVVRTLVDGVCEAGHQTVVWDGRSDSGHRVSSGVYFCRMEAEGFRESCKLVLLK